MQECPTARGFQDVVDVEGMLVLPGLVNAHQHHWYTLFKGISEGMYLEDWLDEILLPLARVLSPDDLRVSGYLAGLEMLTTGTTSFFNHSVTQTGPEEVAASIEPFADLGLRQVFGKELRLAGGVGEEDAVSSFSRTVETWHRPDHGAVQIGGVIETAAHFLKLGFTSESLIQTGSRYAAKNNLRVSDHITGATVWRTIADRIRKEGRGDVDHLMGLGVLGPHWTLVHCTWLSEREIRFCAETNARIAVCPGSAAYVANGTPPVRTFLEAGLCVALGSDGPMVNDSVDMVEQMKQTALLQNVRYLTPAAVSSRKLIRMATINGAHALGMADEIGSLEVGKQADVVVFDMTDWHWGVPVRPESVLVFAGRGADVKHVLIGGDWKIRDAQLAPSVRENPALRGLRREAMMRSHTAIARAGLGRVLDADAVTLELRNADGGETG
jgi:5-methylthioadenosine/S-adenosylhomocysteine deaminase